MPLYTHRCVKSAQMRCYFWSVFSRIRTEYGEILVSLRIQSKCGKICTRNNSVFGHFSRSGYFRCELIWWRSLCMQQLWFTINKFILKELVGHYILPKHPRTPQDTVHHSCRLIPQYYVNGSIRGLSHYCYAWCHVSHFKIKYMQCLYEHLFLEKDGVFTFYWRSLFKYLFIL